jgi:site-specific recombinase XerD
MGIGAQRTVRALAIPAIPTDAPDLVSLVEEAEHYVSKARSANTIRAYRADWRQFTAWCAVHERVPLPAAPETVILYVTDLARKAKTATIRRRLSSISIAHQAVGRESPTNDISVRSAWAGIRRVKGTAPSQKRALLTEDIRRMVAALPSTLIGRRDACLLILGFAAALRRSELVGLDIEDVEVTAEGLVVTIGRSKTDQDSEGRQVGVPYGSDPITCPVRTFGRWVEASRLRHGPLFRPIDRHGRLGDTRLSDRAVALVVKRTAKAAGLGTTTLAGHSLRSGMATSAARGGASEAAIMEITGHKSLPVLRRYIRRGSLFKDNAATRLGL